MIKILFQGDSITDANRDRNNDIDMGEGYPLLIKSHLGFEFAGKYEFINRGISGNRIVDIYARMKEDIINIQPDFMSILVGVNDGVKDVFQNPSGVSNDKYYKIYDMLIEEIKQALPEIKIVIMEPFILKTGFFSENWNSYYKEVKQRAEMSKKIAEKYGLPYIPLQKGFEELAKIISPDYWLYDGVHPTITGHEYIKNEWIRMFKTL